MGEDMAADFLGISEGMFRERVKAGEYPRPIREGRRLLWSRRQLDRFVDAQFNIPAPQTSQTEDASWDDL
jgi:predicted DNA-binding transcriptional regulator AlpA